jgi:hypothetical protein
MSNMKNTEQNLVELAAAILTSDVKKADSLFEQIVDEKYKEAIESKKKAIAESMYNNSEEEINESRVTSSMARDIEQTAESERERGAVVEVNYRLPYVAVKNSNGSEWFMQDEEASNFLDEVPDNVDEEDYALWYFNGL